MKLVIFMVPTIASRILQFYEFHRVTQMSIPRNRAALHVLEDWRKSYAQQRVLELGAGAGALGIALAYDGADATVGLGGALGEEFFGTERVGKKCKHMQRPAISDEFDWFQRKYLKW